MSVGRPHIETSSPPHDPQFARDVLEGLSSTPKSLSSRYFYDDEGSRLFREIMTLPEYYLTRAETRIFAERSAEICEAFTSGADGIDLVELGAGDGKKTALLIEGLTSAGIDFTYQPIDISQEANDTLARRFRESFPNLSVTPHTGDYFQVLGSLGNTGSRRKVVMFLGSNIGNFLHDPAVGFLRQIAAAMSAKDRLFIGFDLQKDPRKILAAYDDSKGVTSRFNLNLLDRINRELGGDFDLSKFSHYAQYQPTECAARSFLISRDRQTVEIRSLGRSFDFEQWEPVFMEISQKYTQAMIDDLARESGFEIERQFMNNDDFYLNSLWRKTPVTSGG